ncbi:MAG: HpcH/HpaI aldolase/citrate lyase family protein [Ilumatobacter sp.]
MTTAFPVPLAVRLTEQESAFGAWLFLREPVAAHMASHAGYDYVCIDMQHGLADFDTLIEMLTAIETGTSVPVVRATALDPGLLGRVIDAGALGVIIPMVNTVEQAEAAVRACRYAPAGDRSVGPIGARTRYGGGYVAAANDVVTVMPMIETVEAVENVEAIAAVPGVGALYVGPADLSVSLGLPMGMDQTDPAFDAALIRIVAACEANGVIPGIHAAPGLVAKRRAQGFTMITVGFDYQPMAAAFNADLAASRDAVNA